MDPDLNPGSDLDLDSDLHPAIFVIDLQDANKKPNFKRYFCLLVVEGIFT
jgi:hypothetical protein